MNNSEPTIVDIFIHHHKDEDTMLGDLCKDITDDVNYPFAVSVESQLEYLQALVNHYPVLCDAVEEFLKRLQKFQAIRL